MTDKELDRNAARRLAIIKHAQEVTGNVAMTCRYYGISRQVFYRWYRRYEEDAVRFVRAVKEAQGLGLTLAEIDDYLSLARRRPGSASHELRVRLATKID